MEWHGLYGRPKVLEISGFGAHLGDRQYFYDALSSERAYKTAFSRENTYNILTVVYDASSRQSIQNRDFFGAYCKKFNQIRKRLVGLGAGLRLDRLRLDRRGRSIQADLGAIVFRQPKCGLAGGQGDAGGFGFCAPVKTQ